MTTPGGVPNLPMGALTLDTLASKTQDMTTTAMKARAAERFPTIFNNSTGLDPSLDITPFGILTSLFSGFNSQVANADPADVNGPEDLPGLLLQFIEGLPVIGQFVDLLDAILGTYTGDDATLLTVQAIFAPIRAIVDALTAVAGGTGGLTNFFPDLLGVFGLGSAGLGTGSPTIPGVGAIPIFGPLFGLFGGATTSTQAGNFFTSITGLFGNPTGLLTGSPTVPALGSIPILGPVFGLFGGASNSTQAGNYFTNLLSLLGGPTLTTAPGSFNTNTAATNFINTVLNPTGLLASVSAIVNAITGSTGSLTNLTAWTNDLTSLLGSPTGLGSGTVTPGALGSTPLLAPLQSLINGVVGGTGNPLSSLISSLTGTQTTASNNASSITSLISNLFGGSTIGSTIQTGAVPTLPDLKLPGLGSLMDGLFGGFTGATSSGATQTNVNAATASQADATAGNSALITQIQAALGAGTPDSDDFERATLGAAWTFLSSTGTGTIPDAHNFHFSGTGTAEYVMRKNDVVGSTDHITSTIVLNQAIPASFISIPPYGGNIDVWVRQTAFTTYATRTGVRLRINSSSLSGSYSLDWVNAGTVTNLTSGSCPIPAAGAILQLEAGASATPRRIVGTINGSPIVDFIDTGLVTTIGTANRYRGFGGRGASGIGLAQGTPDIRQWTAQG